MPAMKCPACSSDIADATAVRCARCGATLGDVDTHSAGAASHLPFSQFTPLGDARFAPGRIFAARYRIVSLLGRGGMGEVYRADDLRLGQPVALKLMAFRSERRQEDFTRFAAEVRLARGIAHPNVCRVYDIGEAEGWPYLSMEYVDGETLGSLVRRIGRLPADKVLDFARQLVAGVAAAHERGVLHRDLKPSNIMVDGRGQIRIMDFGLAVSTAEDVAVDRAGTPAYMAPEQLVGDRLTARTDLYAIGLVLYELYTGRALFAGQTFYDRVRDSERDGPLALGAEIDERVAPILAACLKENPAGRPATAAAVAAMLPGGDPLTAAVAEGRLVSPEMVAAADRRGALSPPIAWLLLAIVVIGALVVASKAEVLTVAPSLLPKAPAVLAERCRDILAHVGHRAVAADSDYWFAAKVDRTAMYFVYRQSPRPLVARNLFRVIGEADPPTDVPGMATVTVDASGRLVGLVRITDSDGRVSASAHTPNWSTLFADAGLDERHFVDVDDASLPLLPHDSARTWERSRDRGSLRVTAATLGDSPVYFAVAGTEATSMRKGTVLTTGRSPRGELILWLFIVSAFVAMSIVARRNLRAGEGDRLNARKIGLFIACAGTVNAALRAHHVPLTVEETALLLGVSGWALVWAGFAWLAYIGLEPYVRRLWPRTLISWTRFLAGRLRDPLVGRDILAGTVVGVVLTAVLILRFIFVPQPIPEALLEPAIESLASTRLLAWSLTFGVIDALQFALAALFFVVLIHMVVGKAWIAVLVLSILAAPIAPGGASGVAGFAWATALLLLFGATLMRVGLLAGVVALSCLRLLTQTVLTLNVDSWYFGSTIVVLLLVLALGTFGFLVSLAGAPAFGVKR